MDNSNRFHSIDNFYLMFDSFISYAIKHTVACSISYITSSPFFSSTKVTSIDESMSLFSFFDYSFLCVNNNCSWSFSYPSPRNPPRSKFANGFWSSLCKHSCYFLITTPVASFYCICKV